jgi:glucose-6-phosphate 1-epimerase
MSVVPGINGQPRVTVTSADGASVEIYLLGATIVSYKTSSEQEVLSVSSAAIFDGAAPIRGGIPIVFPQFALQGPLPLHGFARTELWTVVGAAEPGRIVLSLGDSEKTRASQWPHAFELTYTVTFDSAKLTTELSVSNPASAAAPFAFEALLHTYVSLGPDNVTAQGSAARIAGLQGLTCIPKPSTGYEPARLEDRDSVQLEGEFDRIFTPISRPLVISGISNGSISQVTVEAQASVRSSGPRLGTVAAPIDAVIWNPGAARAKVIADLGDEDWRNFVRFRGRHAAL